MHNKAEIIKGLRRAMEFYRELGFEYLPLKKTETVGIILEKTSGMTQGPVAQQRQKVGDTDNPISDKGKALRRLRERIGDCKRCKLYKARNNIVFGEGNPNAELMFIGEGPGRDEDIQSRPFVGDAGKLLTRLIDKMGFKREEVYIANIVKCRPPYNRNPEEDEISACMPFVEEQIGIIQPKIIVCLGKVSAQSLLRLSTPISKLRGNFFSYNDIPVMPTFHPAYLLRNPKAKWLTWEDMQKVLGKLK